MSADKEKAIGGFESETPEQELARRKQNIAIYNRESSDHRKIVPRDYEPTATQWTEAHNSILRHKPKKVREGE